MRGKSSHSDFFKNLPALVPFSYQGSLQSTSDGIKRVFDNALKRKYQLQTSKSNDIVLVIIDEIGLAEISSNNPLKVLHSLLEPPEVSFVGISNWALDASKMNRGINLSRHDPNEQDLLESAQSINNHINEGADSEKEGLRSIIDSKYLKPLVIGYLSYQESRRGIPGTSNFHGLRDFYSLIQMICRRLHREFSD